jgi:peptidyl-prolyl cis-trans isomerase B (cyclophilin B)
MYFSRLAVVVFGSIKNNRIIMFIKDKVAQELMNSSFPTPKIIFFDIDDTLSRQGVIAEHNKATLEQLAKTDIKLVISTGRSKAILPMA